MKPKFYAFRLNSDNSKQNISQNKYKELTSKTSNSNNNLILPMNPTMISYNNNMLFTQNTSDFHCNIHFLNLFFMFLFQSMTKLDMILI